MRNRDHATGTDEETAERRTVRSRRDVLRASVATGIGAVTLGASSPTSATVTDVDADDDDFHVYLLFGQSNMEGTGEIAPEDRETNSRVQVLQNKTCPNLDREFGEWYVAEPPLNRCWAGLSPGDYFGKTMAAELPEETSIGLVPAAVGGSDIALFQKGAPIGRNGRDIPSQFSGGYEWLLDLAQRAQDVGVIKGILFHQGETNTADPDWKHQVQEIVADLRSDLGIGEVPFLAGELLYGGCCDSHNSEIAQLPDLVPNAHVVSAEGLDGADEAHFDAEGYRELGRRYAEEMLEHVDANADCEPTEITSTVRTPAGDWVETDDVSVSSGDDLTLAPEVADGDGNGDADAAGTWRWSGDVDAETRQVTVEPLESTTYTATYTNDCGETSSVDVSVTVENGSDCPVGATDPDGDGLCEDVDGNGRADTNDVVRLFTEIEDEAYQTNAARFDFDGNGSLAISDVIELFDRL
ncbi:sialate O-acetylesterase [Halomontanus rarus]|uniref:sialate O-acetylesterase n=1 Tax=Halomontanus rarus TaxID=3034020 RepID=UPI0023E8DA09|nr:sialate O-acetylesterase [Halovivax sp. TS33]